MIQLQNLTLRRGAKVLLDGASITIHAGEKVGLWAATAPASRRCSRC